MMSVTTSRLMSTGVKLALLFVSFFLLVGCVIATNEVQETSPSVNGQLTVHFMDVGQGDATLIEGDDFAILIDAGRHDRSDVVPYLKSRGIKSLDLVIGTHPHADHIGQISQVIEHLEVEEVWLSGDVHTSRTFERTIDAILAEDIAYHEPRAGEKYELGDLHIHVLNPTHLTGDFHQGCLAIKVVYGEISFLFTGDIEQETEEEMLARGEEVEATIFQLGHHGSSTSNSEAFLRAIAPDITIYSAAEGNSYGHPHQEVIQRLEELEIPVYGTDQYGTILIHTDGETYSLELNET